MKNIHSNSFIFHPAFWRILNCPNVRILFRVVADFRRSPGRIHHLVDSGMCRGQSFPRDHPGLSHFTKWDNPDIQCSSELSSCLLLAEGHSPTPVLNNTREIIKTNKTQTWNYTAVATVLRSLIRLMNSWKFKKKKAKTGSVWDKIHKEYEIPAPHIVIVLLLEKSFECLRTSRKILYVISTHLPLVSCEDFFFIIKKCRSPGFFTIICVLLNTYEVIWRTSL